MAARRKVKADLIPSDPELPPAAQVQKFITYYVNHRDLKLAAAQAFLLPEIGEQLYKVPAVRERIDRKILLIDVEEAKINAKANLLTVECLDAALVEEVKNKKNGHVRVRAIELGYRRTGLIRDGEFIGVSPTSGAPARTKTYGQIETTTVRRTMTEEVVHSTELPVLAEPTIRVTMLANVEDY